MPGGVGGGGGDITELQLYKERGDISPLQGTISPTLHVA